jgi:hypothetical protein
MGTLKINNGTVSQSVNITSEDIAVSFLAWGSGTVRVTLGTDFKDIVISDRKRYSAIFTAQTPGIKNISLQSEQIIYVDDVKLKNGNKATPWSPAPEDLGLTYPDWVMEFKPSISENGILIGSFTENPNL